MIEPKTANNYIQLRESSEQVQNELLNLLSALDRKFEAILKKTTLMERGREIPAGDKMHDSRKTQSSCLNNSEVEGTAAVQGSAEVLGDMISGLKQNIIANVDKRTHERARVTRRDSINSFNSNKIRKNVRRAYREDTTANHPVPDIAHQNEKYLPSLSGRRYLLQRRDLRLH